jgi:hypothetical protein
MELIRNLFGMKNKKEGKKSEKNNIVVGKVFVYTLEYIYIYMLIVLCDNKRSNEST